MYLCQVGTARALTDKDSVLILKGNQRMSTFQSINTFDPPLKPLILLLLLFFAAQAMGGGFEECPTEAFLIQNKEADLYGVQLSTGFYEEISPIDWGQKKMNALGFNLHDRYLYAYSYYFGSIVKIDSDYNVTPLWPTNMPNMGFYVGDVSVDTNTYYLYRPGSSFGLYRIELDEGHDDYMNMVKIVSGSELSLSIYDLAFHPSNGLAYSVDKWGNLWQIDVQTGVTSKLSNIGQAGVFGAVYFDVTGKLYVSRNKDGHVYRIDTNSGYPVAEFFAYGPSSSNNDGARCALAPIIDMEMPTTDFGRAPDSYGTSINKNGARHDTVGGVLFLGQNVYAEPNAYADNGYQNADDDGITFLTDMAAGQTALVGVEASSDGYLSGWIDYDRDGTFEDDEQVFSDRLLAAGNHTLSVTLPNWTESGRSWSRFRFSSEQNVSPTGGVSDGEVEDYPVELTQPNTVVSYYPTAGSWATVAFEDNWPITGDYDMNDLVMQYRLEQYDALGNTHKISIDGKLMAVGGTYHSGFAFRIPGLLRSEVDVARSSFHINGKMVSTDYLELDREEAIFIITEDVWEQVSAGEDCHYYRTEPGCGSAIQFEFTLEIFLVAGVSEAQIAGFPYDPFIFSSPGFERSYVFGEAPGRRYEIHLQNQAPTEAFQENFFGRGDDASDPNSNRYFVNSNGLPWAINLPYPWRHPVEYMDVKYAYPDLHNFITTGGAESNDWYAIEKSNEQNLFSH